MGRVRVVSLVAGTEREKECISILGQCIRVYKGVYSLTSWKREICLRDERKGEKYNNVIGRNEARR